jgi:hypothetical protein
MKHRSSSALIYAEQSGGLKGENVAKVSNSLLNRLYKFAQSKVYINVRPLAQKLEFAINKIRSAKVPNTEPTLQKLDAVLASRDAELTDAEELRILISTLGSILKQNNFDPPTELDDLYAEIKKGEAEAATPTPRKLAHIPANVQLSLNYLANEVGKQNFRIYGPKGPDQRWGDETQKAINWVKKQYPEPGGVSWGTNNNALFYQINALAESIKNQEATKAPSGTELAQQAPNLIAVLRQANIPNSEQPINSLEWWLKTQYEVNIDAVKEAIILIYNAIEAAKITPPRELNTFSEYVNSLQQQQQTKTSEKVRKALNKFALDTQASKYTRDPMKKSSINRILRLAQHYADLLSTDELYAVIDELRKEINSWSSQFKQMSSVNNTLANIFDQVKQNNIAEAISDLSYLETIGGTLDGPAKTEWFKNISPRIRTVALRLKKQQQEMGRVGQEALEAQVSPVTNQVTPQVVKTKGTLPTIPAKTQEQLNYIGREYKIDFNLILDGKLGSKTRDAIDWFRGKFNVPGSATLNDVVATIEDEYKRRVQQEIAKGKPPREIPLPRA